MMTPQVIVSIISCLLSTITSFLVVYININQKKRDKMHEKHESEIAHQSEENKKLREELRKIQEKKQEAKEDSQDEKIKNLTDTVEKLTVAVDGTNKEVKSQQENMKDVVESINSINTSITNINNSLENVKDLSDQLNKLIQFSNYNFQYTQSLSGLVITIGQSIKQQGLDKDSAIDKAIEDHKKTEKEIIGKIYTIMC
jgi:chromosome segregation ATPase